MGYDKLDDQEDCYKVHQVFASWFQASEQCRLEGAELASIHSKEESKAIHEYSRKQLKGKFSRKRIWIGAHKLRAGNTFEWSDGTTWDVDMVDSSVKQDSEDYCLSMKTSKNTQGKWFDLPCHKIGGRKPFICKMKMKSISLLIGEHSVTLMFQVCTRAMPKT